MVLIINSEALYVNYYLTNKTIGRLRYDHKKENPLLINFRVVGFYSLNIYSNYFEGLKLFNLSALSSTETELKLMAAAAIIGFRSGPPR